MVLRDLAPDLFQFGRFTLEPQRRRLCVDGVPVALSSRAFDILLLLIENRDRVVTKDEIFARVWPGTIVEENNLAVQISALRRALQEAPGDPKLIATVPGRGYRFVGLVEDAALVAEAAPVAEVVTAVVPPAAAAPPPRRRIALIAGLTACGLLVVIGGARYVLVRSHVAPRLSIAVLPFRNLSGEPKQDYLADAISDDLTTDLSHIPGSVVIARESSDVYKGHATPAPEIGRALNVRYLLEGSLSVEAGTFHINAQLIDAPSGTHLWADAFDVSRDKFGAVQAQIVRHIASALDFTLVQVEAARSVSERPDNPDAVDLFLRARSILDQGATMPRLEQAQRLLEHAIQLAPGFGDAKAELGLALVRKISDFGDDSNMTKDHAEAKSAIGEALSQDMMSPEALTASGMLAWEDYRCDQAQPSFKRALELNPNETRAMEGFARCSRELGHMEDMITELKRILTIDPVAPGNAERQQLIGFGYLILGQPADAMEWFNRSSVGIGDADDPRAPPLDPKEWRRLYLIASAGLLGDKAAARALYGKYTQRFPHRTVWRLSSYCTRAMSDLPGMKAFFAALEDAGMPFYADEYQDFGVQPKDSHQIGNDFDPTPLAISGGNRIDAKSLHALLLRTPGAVVLDVGRGAGVIRSGHWIWSQGFEVDPDTAMETYIKHDKATVESPIIVMSDSPLGWDSYNAALDLIARGYRNVLWFRGGEEAWAAQGYNSVDLRPM